MRAGLAIQQESEEWLPAVTNRFDFSPQMKALGCVSAAKHLLTTMPKTKFNPSEEIQQCRLVDR
ncbi:hypothetical protein EYF80_029682 [Liparis tanakae]|uniref:Uncharacterized protein n=1 Tax=Liparis tanakae TaxID=230148 RepID=A0A4Z2H3U4_9TELE|nr:hypothetical protein EYF80_029682 [Liparis tanakae]